MGGSRLRAGLTGVGLLLLLHLGATAQSPTVGDPREDYLRVLQISGLASGLGSFTVRPIAAPRDTAVWNGGHPWAERLQRGLREGGLGVHLTLLPPQLRAFANSRYPVGVNDGAVWPGRGLTTALDFGGALRWKALTVEVRPTALYTQNRAFDLVPVSGGNPFAYPWRPIDLPQRFGPDAFWTLDPGQSEVRLDAWGASVGVSTKNLWWGPATRHPIIMSNNAPGFPHAFLGTDGPLDIRIGEIEAHWIWGRLETSDWFDPAVSSIDRFMTGLVAAYSPSFLPGLTLGGTRVFYAWVPEGGAPVSDYFLVFQGVRKKKLTNAQNPTGDDEHDQMLSLFARWMLPESGFEVYGEWARNDHSWELRDFLLEPEHSQAYMLGLRKANELESGNILTLTAELTHLQREQTHLLRPNPTYYAHGIVTQGYTHKGQIIGAGIGPGGNAQSISADLYTGWGRLGTWLERQVHDNDAYYDLATDPNSTFSTPYCCHDVSFHWGTHALWFKGQFDLGAGMIITREMNRWFYGLDLWNLNLSLSAKWHPR